VWENVQLPNLESDGTYSNRQALNDSRITLKYKCKIEEYSGNHCCCGKAISITYSECVFVDLDVQHAKRMRRIILSPAACLFLPYFSTLSHKRHDFRTQSY
jgi:hypothetical protein